MKQHAEHLREVRYRCTLCSSLYCIPRIILLCRFELSFQSVANARFRSTIPCMSPSLHTHSRQSGFMRLLHGLTRVKVGQLWKPLLFHANSILLSCLASPGQTLVLICSHLIGGPSEHTAAFYSLSLSPPGSSHLPRPCWSHKDSSHQRNPPSNNLLRQFRKIGCIDGLCSENLCTRQKKGYITCFNQASPQPTNPTRWG